MTESEKFVKRTHPDAIARREGNKIIILRRRTDQDEPAPSKFVRLSSHQQIEMWAWDEAAARILNAFADQVAKRRREHVGA